MITEAQLEVSTDELIALGELRQELQRKIDDFKKNWIKESAQNFHRAPGQKWHPCFSDELRRDEKVIRFIDKVQEYALSK